MKKRYSIHIISLFIAAVAFLLFTGCSKDEVPTPAPAPILIPEYYAAIAAGDSHSLALEPDGTLWSLGYNSVKMDSGFVSIAAGASHYLAIKDDGTLWSWGRNNYGQVGNDTKVDQDKPVQIGSGYTAISAGGRTYIEVTAGTHWWEISITYTYYGHSIGLKVDGTIWAWGSLVGDGTNELRTVPVMIGSDYKAIAAGGAHSLALKSDGTIWAWGDNYWGQLGDGTNVSKAKPVRLAGSDYVAISAGGNHSLALKADGTLWAWGVNAYGQIGDGTNEFRNRPVQVGSGYIAISAGNIHSLALKDDGTLWAWGDNGEGQLGDGSNVQRNSPVLIGSGYVAISAGGTSNNDYYHWLSYNGHSLALKADGTLWAWGDNKAGLFGTGTYEDKNIPVQIGAR